MEVLVINGSPRGKSSITLKTVQYIAMHFPKCHFSFLDVISENGRLKKDFTPAKERILQADLLLFSYPVYTFLVPSQVVLFLDLLKKERLDLSGKYASQVSTSKHFFDTTAQEFMEENFSDLGLISIRGLSADMEDLLAEEGRKEAVSFFRRVIFEMNHGMGRKPSEPVSYSPVFCREHPAVPEKKEDFEAVIAADIPEEGGESLYRMIRFFQYVFPYRSRVVNIRTFPFAGGCLGCLHCVTSGKCIWKDGFDEFLRKEIQSADAIVYAFPIEDHAMGYPFKVFDDRQFCNGHRTVTQGKPVGYLASGPLGKEHNLSLMLDARAQTGGNPLAGMACDEADPEREVRDLALRLAFILESGYEEPARFYGTGGRKIFRDLVYEMQGLMQEDDRFYREHHLYDFPQKEKKTILGMKLLGAALNNEQLKKKIEPEFSKGMTAPYDRVLLETERRLSRSDTMDGR